MTSKEKKNTPGKSPPQNPEKASENSQSQSAPSNSATSGSSSQAKEHKEVEVEPEIKNSSRADSNEKEENEKEEKAKPGESETKPDQNEEAEAAQGSIFGALLGKMLSTGESQIKRAAEFKLPREVINFSKEQMKGLKHDMVKTVGSEVSHFLKNLNLGKELVKVFTYLTFEVKMQIRLVPSDENKFKLKPESKIKVVSKKHKKPKDDEPQK
ncbi:MAG: hypothetical protein PF689_07415 [Deltaproteobacteria bacterium]|jgi:hypothetical protein|nr:hypothetical protein [Deltaproteobacteria bacterium]